MITGGFRPIPKYDLGGSASQVWCTGEKSQLLLLVPPSVSFGPPTNQPKWWTNQQANKNSLNFSSDRAQRPKDLRVDSRRCDLRRPWTKEVTFRLIRPPRDWSNHCFESAIWRKLQSGPHRKLSCFLTSITLGVKVNILVNMYIYIFIHTYSIEHS
jgi:hypothetical protein